MTDDWKQHRQVIEKELGVEARVYKQAYKLDQKTCLVKFESSKDNEKFMKNKYKLKTHVNGSIYINEDTTKNERENGKQTKV